jgi:hypothetical protein
LIVLAGGLPLLLGVLEELYLWPTSVVGVAVLDSEVTPKGSLIGMLLAWGVLALLAALVAIIRVSRDGSRPSLRLAGWILIVLGVVAAWDLPTAAVAGHLIHQAYPNAPTGTSSIRIGLFAISLLAPAGVALLAIRGSLIRHPAHGSDA